VSAATPRLIVHVVHRFAVGGLENGIVNLLNQLPADSWQHLVVSLTEIDKKFVQRVTREDVKYLALHKGPGHAVPLYPRLFKLFRKLRPAIVHTRNLAALEACVPAWAAGIPARVHGEHGREVDDLDGSNRRKQWVRRAFRPFVTRYVALSPELERYLDERVGVPAHRIQQIYNGVDTARFCPTPSGRTPIKGCPFQDSGLWLVGTVGRMDAVKDQTNLARGFVRALRLRPEARRRMRLVLVGDGRLKGPVEAILQEAGARDLVWLPGERADVPRLLQGIDCFVLPSLAEGVSNTILEAMACGLPVIATQVGANSELVEDGITGRLVPAGDSEALARDIIAYFDDPAMAKRHGRAGRHRAEQSFSLELMVEHYHRLYTDLVRTRVPRERKARATAAGRRTNG
jgi:sugar transferase (PEP-CTERM/EpsH1 system associated)